MYSSHEKGVRRTSEEEKHPEIRTAKLVLALSGMCVTCAKALKFTKPGMGKILLDRFINRFVLDENATTAIEALRICQSG